MRPRRLAARTYAAGKVDSRVNALCEGLNLAESLAAERDAKHLRRAIELASEARGMTSPNPLVGAVVVKSGRVIGEGFHTAAGRPHAEREALAACTEDPAGATMYVSLEPCAHDGRTPPCTDAIVEAGIKRVVVASDDPTEKASGRGLGILRDEGIAVEMHNGDVADAARLINQPFRKHARTGRPLVVLKTAMTLDGKVATSSGDSQWISGEDSRARAHRWRAESDAVVVGIGTVLSDDPLLTARVEAVPRQPSRVVFDSEARLPLDSRLVKSSGDSPLIVICARAAPRTATEGLEAAGAEVIVASGQNESARVVSALDELGSRGIQSVLLEGGPHLAGAFLDAGQIDVVHTFIAPILAGGRHAKVPVEGEGVERIAAAQRALSTEAERIGDDILISSRFAEW
jgi:diaminohydroxyphosphoribosylaminopyrimidine deaminase/5-amino-6-(5-phosphoribosylamino)uracil reductase